jgi:hypothetical protein
VRALKPDSRFIGQDGVFWAHVRSISQAFGYTERKTKNNPEPRIKVPRLSDIVSTLEALGLTTEHVVDADGSVTAFGQRLLDYFQCRADLLNDEAQQSLMTAKEAEAMHRRILDEYPSDLPLVMNKQKGDKAQPSLLTNMVSRLVEANMEGDLCDFDPRRLTTFTRDGIPVRTLSRRVDGAYPSTINPVAIWEIKEYYYTTTFGSRVADGVYETQLDGMELEELRQATGIDCKHYLFVDARYTWWEMGRSYLCRIIDMLHMGLVDEVFFGKEIEEALPEAVRSWQLADQPHLDED